MVWWRNRPGGGIFLRRARLDEREQRKMRRLCPLAVPANAHVGPLCPPFRFVVSMMKEVEEDNTKTKGRWRKVTHVSVVCCLQSVRTRRYWGVLLYAAIIESVCDGNLLGERSFLGVPGPLFGLVKLLT